MPIYRYYRIRSSGRIAGPGLDHELADDQEAVSYGRTLLKDLDVEIWQGPRVVAYLRCREDEAPGTS